MKIDDYKKINNKISGQLKIDYCLKNSTWMNIGGKAKIFFKPESLKDLIIFLKLSVNEKIHVLGAGSNLLIKEDLDDKIFIKLGKSFNKISILQDNLIVSGCSVSDKSLAKFALDNSLSGLEFLSCIPGSVGGGIRMNSGCFGSEFKDVLVSIQTIDFNGNVRSIKAEDIKFGYRETSLPRDMIFLSATFKCRKKDQTQIRELMDELKLKKETSQPSRIKTGGSTFKNPINQTEKKVWELIKDSVPENIHFGDAKISPKHSNFFINDGNATFEDMLKLINYVKTEVKKKKGISLDLELEIIK